MKKTEHNGAEGKRQHKPLFQQIDSRVKAKPKEGLSALTLSSTAHKISFKQKIRGSSNKQRSNDDANCISLPAALQTNCNSGVLSGLVAIRDDKFLLLHPSMFLNSLLCSLLSPPEHIYIYIYVKHTYMYIYICIYICSSKASIKSPRAQTVEVIHYYFGENGPFPGWVQ